MNDSVTITTATMDKIVKLQDTAIGLIRTVAEHNRELRSISGKIILATDSTLRKGYKDSMTELATDIYLKINTVKQQLEELQQFKFHYQDTETAVLAEQVYKAINVQYVEVMRAFFEIYLKHHQHNSAVVQAQYQAMHPTATSEEFSKISDLEQVLREAALGPSLALQTLSYVKSKHQDILKIERGILEIKQLMDMVAILTAAQADFIEEISGNVIYAKEQVKSGLSRVKR
jgi:t-SNARE complex subunit (syntaxin)